MPTVPRYGDPKVQEAALPGVRNTAFASEETFGGGKVAERITQGTTQLADESTKIAEAAKRAGDELMVTDKVNQLSSWTTDYYYNQKSGALLRKGKDAFSLPDEAKTAFEKKRQEVESGLQNETQRRAFRQHASAYAQDMDRKVQAHAAGEFQKFDAEVTTSLIKNEQDAAALSYGDPERISLALQTQEDELKRHAERNGIPADQLQELVTEARSKTHAAVINRMIANGDDLRAREYFDGVKNDIIDGEQRTKLEHNLKEGSVRGESQRISDSIFAKAPDMATAIEQARKVKNEEVRDAVVTRIKDNYATKKAAENQLNEDLHRQATNLIDGGASIDQLMTQHNDVWQRFSESEKTSLMSYARNRQKGIEPQTNWRTYYEYVNMAASPELKSEFLKKNLFADRDKFADAEFKHIVGLQADLRRGDAKAESELDGYRTSGQIVNDTLSAAGIDPTPKEGTTDSKQVAIFRRQVDEQVQQTQQRLGKKIGTKEVQDIVDNLIVKGTKPGTGVLGFFKTQARRFELEPGQKIEITPKDVPRTERLKIEDALRRRGMPVTDDKVLELYNRKFQGGN